ncbi:MULTISPECIES: hypothetical protein [Priestia]|jgi:hypothetical protein|uniref:Lipoprotein, putative n=1 Tax=Priestia megaterium (strain ATCC 12872 / QMB1551) TaxID=545693 RepID=D5E2R5_PRIM1|nr:MULTISPECIES: hypothetical protein [Priestia]ADE68692.1 lipoprotein, putative [Priestia megaterium QM B1551]MBG9930248.1 hypothetical protein [Priestia aryabhattai]MCA4156392.1 hypothetical protein [Priestia megaterium]MCR8864509.1 hypothetical protein [Priestia megaterium]MDR0128321.1 hypothetical protein [Priestia megaterium]
MKKFSLSLFIAFLVFIISACSNTEYVNNVEHLKLQKTEVRLTDDKKIVGEMIVPDKKNKSKRIVPTELYYTFTMENTSNNIMALSDLDKTKLRIEPDKELVSAVKEAIGSNIYDMDNSKLGFGMSIGEILSKGTSKFTLNYTLGAKQKNNELPLLPTEEKLKKLQANALKGTLIISQDGKDIAKFRLDSSQ